MQPSSSRRLTADVFGAMGTTAWAAAARRLMGPSHRQSTRTGIAVRSAINPITWTTSEETATASQNLGSIRLNPRNGGKPVMEKDGQARAFENMADARVDKKRGVVVCSTPNPKHYEFGFPEGVYRTFDYPFYFFNVRANATSGFNPILP